MRAAPTRLRLRVSPGAGRSRIVGPHGGAWKVCVAAAPERGRANDAVCRLLAETLGLPRAGVTLVSGHAAKDKVLELDGIGEDEMVRRLTAAAAPGKDN